MRSKFYPKISKFWLVVILKTRFVHVDSKNGWQMALARTNSQCNQNVRYQRINCETCQIMVRECKMLCCINPDIQVAMVTKWTQWPLLFLFKFMSGTLKESLYQIRRKFIEQKLRDHINTLSYNQVIFWSGTIKHKRAFAWHSVQLQVSWWVKWQISSKSSPSGVKQESTCVVWLHAALEKINRCWTEWHNNSRCFGCK